MAKLTQTGPQLMGRIRPETQRILDGIARRLLTEELDAAARVCAPVVRQSGSKSTGNNRS